MTLIFKILFWFIGMEYGEQEMVIDDEIDLKYIPIYAHYRNQTIEEGFQDSILVKWDNNFKKRFRFFLTVIKYRNK